MPRFPMRKRRGSVGAFGRRVELPPTRFNPPDQATEFNSDGTSGDMDQYAASASGDSGGLRFSQPATAGFAGRFGALSVNPRPWGVGHASPVAPEHGWKISPGPLDTNPSRGGRWAASGLPALCWPQGGLAVANIGSTTQSGSK